MEKIIIDHWQVLLFIITLLFNAGVMFKTFKDKPSEKRVEEMIEEKFDNHCPFTDRITELESSRRTTQTETALYRTGLEKALQKEQEFTHLALQRIHINLESICNSLGIKYYRGNGN
jgi:hypothetical protein